MSPAQRVERQRAFDRAAIESPGFNAAIVARAQKRMARMDALAPDMRELVHDFGLEIVDVFLMHGIKRAKTIRYLIDTVRATPYDNGQNRFRFNTGPNRKQNAADDSWMDDGEVYSAKPSAPTAMQAAFDKFRAGGR